MIAAVPAAAGQGVAIHTVYSDPANGIVSALYAIGHQAYAHPHLRRADFHAAAMNALAEHVFGERQPGWLGAAHRDACRHVIAAGRDLAFAHEIGTEGEPVQLLTAPLPDCVSRPASVLWVDPAKFYQLSHADALEEIRLLDLAMERRIGDFTEAKDFQIAALIADRAMKMYAQTRPVGEMPSRTEILMDIVGLHERGRPMRFADWLVADGINFMREVAVVRSLDRQTMSLPRSAPLRFAA